MGSLLNGWKFASALWGCKYFGLLKVRYLHYDFTDNENLKFPVLTSFSRASAATIYSNSPANKYSIAVLKLGFCPLRFSGQEYAFAQLWLLSWLAFIWPCLKRWTLLRKLKAFCSSPGIHLNFETGHQGLRGSLTEFHFVRAYLYIKRVYLPPSKIQMWISDRAKYTN